MFHRVLMSIALILALTGLVSANYVLIVANLGETKDSGDGAAGPGGLPQPGPGKAGLQPMPMMPKGPMNPMRPMDAGKAAGPGGVGATPAEADPEAIPLYVVAVVEYKNFPTAQKLKALDDGVAAPEFFHKWGKSNLGKTRIVQAAIVRSANKNIIQGVARRFQAKFDPGRAGSYTADQLVEAAEWALSHGLVTRDKSEKERNDKVALVLDKLVEVDAKHPAAVAYSKLKPELARSAPAGDPTLAMRKKLVDGFRDATSPHYLLLHDISAGNDSTEVKNRLERLENAYRSFYYWFALRGHNLPAPRDRLVAILTQNEKEYDRLYDVLTAGQAIAEVGGSASRDQAVPGLGPRPLRPIAVSDGFLGRRDNLLVFSARRLDAPYDALEKHAAPLWQAGFNRQDIFKGLKFGIPKEMQAQPEKVVEAMTMGLLLKAMEEDADQAGTSHAVARQLLYASGLLPRNVAVPEWVEFGLGSFFETSPGSPWPTVGAANFEYHGPFKAMQKGKRLERMPVDTLRAVITDSYFRRLANAPAKPVALRKAHVTAWSLTYFLAQKKLDGLLRYFKELSKMPRDLELSDEALIGCFARAFDCVDANKKVDLRKLTTLANQWVYFVETTPVEPEQEAVQQLVQSKLRELGDPKAKGTAGGTQPGQPQPPGKLGN